MGEERLRSVFFTENAANSLLPGTVSISKSTIFTLKIKGLL
jgi:hypothetical protein